MNLLKSGLARFGLVIFMFVFGSNIQSVAQLSAIHDFKRNDNVVVTQGIDTLKFAFAGGLNNCQFINIDINLDGTDDLVVFDRHGNRILPFITTSGLPFNYTFMPESASLLPKLEHWIQAVDYNADGRKDIFTYTTGGIKVYRNDSETSLKFTLVTNPFLLSLQGTTLTNILVTYADYPAINDIDKDGDMDILTFWGLGSFVEWHKNTSVERFGNADSLTFERVTSCWGYFAEGNEDNSIVFDTCNISDVPEKANIVPDNDPKHTGSTILVHDLNSDGLPDITIGDVDFKTLIHLTNGGSLTDARMVSKTTDFPGFDNPVQLSSFPAAMLSDVNNDGIKDLLVSPFEPSLTKGENFESVWLYLNYGSNQHPDYRFVSDNFLQAEIFDLGSGAYPVFFDYNKDGLTDILVGNYGYTDTCKYFQLTGLQCEYRSGIALLLNNGTVQKPSFYLAGRNLANLDSLHCQSLIPALGDMDGDGDADLVCGNSKGNLVYCENIAPPGQPAEFKFRDAGWYSIDVGDFAAPSLMDMDNDGLIDLIIGKRNGTLNYYRNTGNKTEPDFYLVSDHFGGVDVTNTQLSNYGYNVPCFYKDKNSTTYLFAGSEFGDTYVYDMIDNNLEGNFRMIGTVPKIKEGLRSSVALGNLNNDTLTDMLVGNYAGGLGLYYGIRDKIFGINESNQKYISELVLTPNPAYNKVVVSLKEDLSIKNGTLAIISLYGETLKQYSQITFPFTMDVSGFSIGVYLVFYKTAGGIIAGKLVICN